MKDTLEKIENGTIRIENGRLIGLGVNDRESICIHHLEELLDHMSTSECEDILNDLVQLMGCLAFYLLKNDVTDPSGALICYTPNENHLYAIGLISKIFKR